MPARRVIFVNRFYWPDSPATAQLLTDLAEGLAAQSIPVIVATTGSAPLLEAETQRGVAIARLSERRARHASLWQRARDFLRFRRALRTWLKANLQRGDVLVCLTDPPLIGALAARVAQRKGARVIHWIQDIFPEIAVDVLGLPLLNCLRGSRDAAWRSASLCITPGEAMRDFVIARGISATHTAVIPNWAPAGLAPAAHEAVAIWKCKHGLAEKFIVMYSGNLGRAHDFTWFAPLAKAFREDPRVAFVFVGGGPRLAEVKNAAAEAGLANVHYFPSAPRQDLAAVLSAADVHLVSIRAGCENLVFPSKLAGIAAVGRPAIVIGPANCEPARAVVSGGWGQGFSPADIDAMTQTLRGWMDNASERQSLQENALASSAQNRFELALSAWKRILTDDGDSSRAVNGSLVAS
jgi:glycosyltransferase involved in cell wall biosynthesis